MVRSETVSYLMKANHVNYLQMLLILQKNEIEMLEQMFVGSFYEESKSNLCQNQGNLIKKWSIQVQLMA